VQPPARAQGKPQNELEALRKEVELLRLNLLVVLEKVRSQEAELTALRGQRGGPTTASLHTLGSASAPKETARVLPNYGPPRLEKQPTLPPHAEANPVPDAEALLQAVRDAKDDASRQRLLDLLVRALRQIREQPGRPRDTAPRPESAPQLKRS
jgi:hypothetical protein